MTPTEFALTVCKLSADDQNKFYDALREQLTDEEVSTVSQFVNMTAMFHNPAKYKAMKNAVRDALCEEFYGHPCEESESKGFDPCNPVYMPTILG